MGGEKYMKEPKLRFKADDGSDFPDWEECTVGELFVSVVKKNKDGSIQNVITNSAEYGLIPQRDFFDKDIAIKENTSNYTIIQNGDFVYNPRKSTTAPFGPFNIYERDEAGIVSPLYTCLTPKYKEMTPYLSWYFRTNKWHPYIVTHGAQSGARHDRVGMTATLMNGIPVIYPSLPEQQKIADFLSTIDTVIEKQQATVSAWEERKKGVMQKLFSQEVRFKADDGSDFPDWEEKSFVNTFDSLNNSTFSRDCLNYENGSVKYIHYGDILVKYNSSVDVCDAIVPFVNEDLDCERFAILQDGDIVIADTAEDDTVGKVIEIENTSNVKTIAGLHTIACRPKEKFASKYLGYYMNSDEYHNQLRPYMQGIKVTSISKSNIALTKIMVPSLPEQQKIADCLSALDAVIEKQKETLEKWQELKKGLLQQMFV